MSRQAKLGQKNGYYYSEAGGRPRYYGKVGEVPYAAALQEFRDALATKAKVQEVATVITPTTPSVPSITLDELVKKFLEWLKRHRDDRTFKERARHLGRFQNAFRGLQAAQIEAHHLEDFQDQLQSAGNAPEYVKKHATSVRFLFNRAVKMGWLPAEFKPFVRVEAIRVQEDPLDEGDLPTDDEVRALFAHADDDLSPRSLGRGRGFRRREPHEYRKGDKNPWRGFETMLRTFHATGARTSELASVRVGDLQPRTRQLILGKHKRSSTQKVSQTRQIVLNEETFARLELLAHGRNADDNLFTLPGSSRPWNRFTLSKRFVAVRERAGVRNDVTIYSFRHLWISEALMSGVDILTVARLAGTSVDMIERTYGHLRTSHLITAQGLVDRARVGRF